MRLCEAIQANGTSFEFYIKGDTENTYQIAVNTDTLTLIKNMQTGKTKTVRAYTTKIIVRIWDETTNKETTKF